MYGSTCLLAIKGGNRLPKHLTVRRTRTGGGSPRSHLFSKFECEKAVVASKGEGKSCVQGVHVIHSVLGFELRFQAAFLEAIEEM